MERSVVAESSVICLVIAVPIVLATNQAPMVLPWTWAAVHLLAAYAIWCRRRWFASSFFLALILPVLQFVLSTSAGFVRDSSLQSHSMLFGPEPEPEDLVQAIMWLGECVLFVALLAKRKRFLASVSLFPISPISFKGIAALLVATLATDCFISIRNAYAVKAKELLRFQQGMASEADRQRDFARGRQIGRAYIAALDQDDLEAMFELESMLEPEFAKGPDPASSSLLLQGFVCETLFDKAHEQTRKQALRLIARMQYLPSWHQFAFDIGGGHSQSSLRRGVQVQKLRVLFYQRHRPNHFIRIV